MTEEQLKLQIERMEMMCKSFQSNSEKYPEFLPEFEASQSINNILQKSIKITIYFSVPKIKQHFQTKKNV